MSVTGLRASRTAARRLAIGLMLAVLLSLLSVARAAGRCGLREHHRVREPAAWRPDQRLAGERAGDSTIQGFATSMSVNVGETESFKISTPATSYHIDILRVGYYQGNGARKVVSNMLPTASLPQTQPTCLNGASGTGLIDCGNWAVSASWTVPSHRGIRPVPRPPGPQRHGRQAASSRSSSATTRATRTCCS